MKLQYFIIALICLAGCNLMEYHPYSGDIVGETGLTEINLVRISEFAKDKTNFKFAFISDTQGYYDETCDFVDLVNSRNDIDFVLHGGDLTDFALPKEFKMMRDKLLKMKMPWLTAIGNHDCLVNGVTIYRNIFGQENYSFTVGKTRFLVINTNALEYDYFNVPDMSFLRTEVEYVTNMNRVALNDGFDGPFTQTVILMHSYPGDNQFNNVVIPEFRELLQQLPGLFCLCGHTHTTATLDCLDNGIPFYIVSALKKRQYLVFSINNDSYEMEVCDF